MKRAQNRPSSTVPSAKGKSIQQPCPSKSPVKATPTALKKKTQSKEELQPLPTAKRTAQNKKLSPKQEDSDNEEVVIESVRPVKKNVKSPVAQKSPQKIAETPSKLALPKVDEGVKIVFVGNLPVKLTKTDVADYFSGCGKIVEVRVARTKEGFLKGFAHIEFDSTNAVRRAIQLNGKEFSGRVIRVDPAKSSKSKFKLKIRICFWRLFSEESKRFR